MNSTNNDLLIPLVRDTKFNWNIFKKDVVQLSKRSLENDHYTDRNVYYKNNLFGPIGLTFKDGVSLAIAADSVSFNTEKEMKNWLKESKPLVYMLIKQPNYEKRGEYFMSDLHLCTPDRIKNIQPEEMKYIVRYFSSIGKLPLWKYSMQWFFGKYNFKWIRPFLYRMLVMN